MAGSAQLPSEGVDDVIDRFQRDTSWTVSAEARTIIASAMRAIMVDDIGLGDCTDPSNRRELHDGAMRNLRSFLDRTAGHAELQRARFRNDSRVIGGVVVLQNMQAWRSLMDCGCWPRDRQ